MTSLHPRTPAQRLGLWLGIGLFLLLLVLPAPEGFSDPAWRTAALAGLMAVWWSTEALPIPATAMLPLAAGPLLGIVPVERAGHGYGSSTIFLILGGCLLALALERWQLHRRIAFFVVTRAGASARRLVLGVMAATAFVSMWVSNTSTTLMMLPVAVSIASLVAPDHEQADPRAAQLLDGDRAGRGLCGHHRRPRHADRHADQRAGRRVHGADLRRATELRRMAGVRRARARSWCCSSARGGCWWPFSHPFHLPDITGPGSSCAPSCTGSGR